MKYRLFKINAISIFGLILFSNFLAYDLALAQSGLDPGKETTYQLNFSTDDLAFSRLSDYDAVKLAGCFSTRDVGKPELPFKVLQFALDYDKELESAEVVSDFKEPIRGIFNIYPAQESVRFTEAREFTEPDQTAYASAKAYPESTVEVVSQGVLSGINIVTIHVYPLEYIPAQKRLLLHSNLKLKITQKKKISSSKIPSSITSKSLKGKETLSNYLTKIVINPQDSEAQLMQSPANRDPIDYFIITSQAFIDSGVFQPLIDSKIARGLSVGAESVEDIEAAYSGRDTQEKIRNFIIDKHTNNGVTWVLLGGDTNIIPTRFVSLSPYWSSGLTSDMYYSDLDGDWDADGDSLFGEFDDDLDLYPDVFVGRAPAETEEEAQAFISKIPTYEDNISTYADTALLLGYSDFADVGSRINNLIESDYLPEDYTTTKYYQSDPETPAYADLAIEAINQGQHLINHIDYASTNILGTGDDSLTIGDIDNLTNSTKPAIFRSVSHRSAAIEYDCIGEHWITNPNGGGVAFIGNSRIGHHPEADENLDPAFYDSLFLKGITNIGMTLADSKMPFVGLAKSSSIPMMFNILELNLLGDPEMTIYTEGGPQLYITSPTQNSYLHGSADIYGSAYIDEGFQSYELLYAPSDDPDDETLIHSSPAPVEEGLLGAWDTSECADGEYLLILKLITDSRVIESHNALEVVVDNENQPPEFTGLLNKGVVIGRLNEFQVQASDPDDPETPWGTLTYSAQDLPSGALFNPQTQTFLWQPSEADEGIYKITFIASDSEYEISEEVTLRTYTIEETLIDEEGIMSVWGFGFPKINQGIIVWCEGDYYNSNIYMYDCSTGETSAVTTGGSYYYPDVYGNKIAFADFPDARIYQYDILSGETELLHTTPFTHTQGIYDLDFYDDKIVWADTRDDNNNDIYMYDITAEEEVPICLAPRTQYVPKIYGDKIVWMDNRYIDEHYHYINMYDLTEETEEPVYLDSFHQDQWWASIHGEKIAWQEKRENDYDIYVFDLISEEAAQITQDPQAQTYPTIYENNLAWLDYRNGDNPEIYGYDLVTDEETQITDSSTYKEVPEIYADKVIWIDYESGYEQARLWMAEFTPFPYGDVDFSGSVTTTDALMVFRHALGIELLTPKQIIVGDVNLDNRIDTTDARLIFQCALGMITLPQP